MRSLLCLLCLLCLLLLSFLSCAQPVEDQTAPPIVDKLNAIDWSKPTKESLKTILDLNLSQRGGDVTGKIIQLKPLDQLSWSKSLVREIALQSGKHLDDLCKKMDALSLYSLIKKEEPQLQALSKLFLDYMDSLSDICSMLKENNENIKEHDRLANKIDAAYNFSLSELERKRAAIVKTESELGAFDILVGFVVADYGDALYEVSNVRLFSALGWYCSDATRCQRLGYDSLNDGYTAQRAVLALNNFTFNRKGKIAVLVKKTGFVPIVLKNGLEDIWPSYEESPFARFNELQKEHMEQASILTESERIHRQGAEEYLKAKELIKSNYARFNQIKEELRSRFKSLPMGFKDKDQEIVLLNSLNRPSLMKKSPILKEISKKAPPQLHTATPKLINEDQGDKKALVYEVFDTYKDPNNEKYLALKKKPYPKRRAKGNKLIAELLDGTLLNVISRGHGYKKAWCKVKVISGEHKNKKGYAHCKWIRRLSHL